MYSSSHLSVEFNRHRTDNALIASRTSPRAAVFLEIRSDDRGWVQQSFVQLSEEIGKGVPWWSWCASMLGQAFLSLVIWVAVLAAELVATWRPSFQDAFAALLYLPLPTLCAIMAAVVNPLIFPRFEVHGEGAGSSGSRRLVLAGTVLLSIPVGIAINLVTG